MVLAFFALNSQLVALPTTGHPYCPSSFESRVDAARCDKFQLEQVFWDHRQELQYDEAKIVYLENQLHVCLAQHPSDQGLQRLRDSVFHFKYAQRCHRAKKTLSYWF